MSVQKKSLISNRTAAKKAIFATKPDLSGSQNVVLAKNAAKGGMIATKAHAMTKAQPLAKAHALTKAPALTKGQAMTKSLSKVMTKSFAKSMNKSLTKGIR
jgi:hypothetical protein